MFYSDAFRNRFWMRVDKSGPIHQDLGTHCWLWTASLSTHGYGQVGVGPLIRRCHRVAWELINGPLPNAIRLCHRCDVRRCVRPDHMFLGTQADNLTDMRAKGRWKATPRFGVDNPRAHFTDDEIVTIRRRFAQGETCSHISRHFSVYPSTISSIVKRHTWKHIT